MTAMESLVAAGFAALIQAAGAETICCNGLRAQCVMSDFKNTRKASRNGREQDYGKPVCELLDSERKRLGIADHTTVEVEGVKMKVIEIDPVQPGDPLCRLHLQYQP